MLFLLLVFIIGIFFFFTKKGKLTNWLLILVIIASFIEEPYIAIFQGLALDLFWFIIFSFGFYLFLVFKNKKK